MSLSLLRRLEGLEASLRTAPKREPRLELERKGGRDSFILKSLHFPAGTSDWRDATPDELAKYQHAIETVREKY